MSDHGKTQHVYFITDSRRRYVKIGVSNNPWWRIEDLQAGSPLKLKLDLILNFSDRSAALSYEDTLHQTFAEFWRFREWFDYAPPIKEFARAWLAGEAPKVEAPPCTTKQYVDDHGACLSKAEFMAVLRAGFRQ